MGFFWYLFHLLLLLTATEVTRLKITPGITGESSPLWALAKAAILARSGDHHSSGKRSGLFTRSTSHAMRTAPPAGAVATMVALSVRASVRAEELSACAAASARASAARRSA